MKRGIMPIAPPRHIVAMPVKYITPLLPEARKTIAPTIRHMTAAQNTPSASMTIVFLSIDYLACFLGAGYSVPKVSTLTVFIICATFGLS